MATYDPEQSSFDPSQSSLEFGQSLLADAQRKRKKSKRRQKKIKNVSYLLSAVKLGDMVLANKAQKDLGLLNERKVFDLAARKSDFADKTAFEYLYDTIDKAGFDASNEESYRNYFYNKAIDDYTKSNVNKEIHPDKDEWADVKMENYIVDWKKDLTNWKPWLRATQEEFSQPVKDYYKQQIRNTLRPGNTSAIRKILEKFGLWEDKEIKQTWENAQYAGALRHTRSVDEAYKEAMGNTMTRLQILRAGEEEFGDYKDLPDLHKWILYSKNTDSNLVTQAKDSFIIDKSGMFYGKNFQMNPDKLPSAEKNTAQWHQKQRLKDIILGGKATDSNPDGNIFYNKFHDFAVAENDPGTEKVEGLDWTEEEWSDWFNLDIKFANGMQDLLYHRSGGPEDLAWRDHFAENFGGQWQTDKPSSVFILTWARRAQNIWDTEKRAAGLKLTEGASPADWTPYLERAFGEVVNNDLILRKDGRLEIVETSGPGRSVQDRLGPKPFREGEEDIISEEGGAVPGGVVPGGVVPGGVVPGGAVPGGEGTRTTELPVLTIRDNLSDDQKIIYDEISNTETITVNDKEIKGASAFFYNELYNVDRPEMDIKKTKSTLITMFPNSQLQIEQLHNEYLETRGPVVIEYEEDLTDVERAREGLVEEGAEGLRIAGRGIKRGWKSKVDTERRNRLLNRIEGTGYVSDRQFEKDLENAGLSVNATSNEIREYLNLSINEDAVLAEEE